MLDPRLIAAAARSERVRWLVLVALICGVVLAVAGTVTLFAVGDAMMSSGSQNSSGSDLASYCVPSAQTQQAYGDWSAEQTTNAATIIRVGEAENIPQYGQIIAVATGMQESSLNDDTSGDLDSVGVFQQRPSQGWGTVAQLEDVTYAAGKFYAALQQVQGWQNLPLTVAAQDVQHSGYPGAYAKWQQSATVLVDYLTGGGTSVPAAATAASSSCQAGTVAQTTSAGIGKVLDYALSTYGTMYDYGGTCTNPHSSNMALHCDCSSEVQVSFEQIGIDMPRTVQDQYNWGMDGHAIQVPISEAQIGDVVEFPSYLGANTLGHTGIVTDPSTDTMIEAPETGEPVKYGSYNPAGLPYHSYNFHILRFVQTTGNAS